MKIENRWKMKRKHSGIVFWSLFLMATIGAFSVSLTLVVIGVPETTVVLISLLQVVIFMSLFILSIIMIEVDRKVKA